MKEHIDLQFTLGVNVVHHSGLGSDDTMVLRVHIEPRHVRVEMRDEGRGFPTVLEPRRRPGEFGGHGLGLVERIAAQWGTGEGPGGYVWFELDEPADSSPS